MCSMDPRILGLVSSEFAWSSIALSVGIPDRLNPLAVPAIGCNGSVRVGGALMDQSHD